MFCQGVYFISKLVAISCDTVKELKLQYTVSSFSINSYNVFSTFSPGPDVFHFEELVLYLQLIIRAIKENYFLHRHCQQLLRMKEVPFLSKTIPTVV